MDNHLLLLVVHALHVTVAQVVGVFGIFFFFGFLLSKLQTWTNYHYRNAFGWKGILWTAWIGTPFHELGHYILAKLFRHEVTALALFQPNKETGGLGHVDHSYKKSSLFQSFGNFFIGAAPMLFGIVILVTLVYYILPNGKDIIQSFVDARTSLSSLIKTIPHVLTMIFSREHMSTWHFWLFLYISFAISAHIAPSKQDRKGMWSGFAWIVVVLFIINLTALFLRIDLTDHILRTSAYLNVFVAMAVYALLLSTLHYVLSLLIIYPISRVRSRLSKSSSEI
jgi:hypothetical protein